MVVISFTFNFVFNLYLSSGKDCHGMKTSLLNREFNRPVFCNHKSRKLSIFISTYFENFFEMCNASNRILEHAIYVYIYIYMLAFPAKDSKFD